jgi:hypothetical protein
VEPTTRAAQEGDTKLSALTPGYKARSASTTPATDLAQYVIYRSKDPALTRTLHKAGMVEYDQPSVSKRYTRAIKLPKASSRPDT